MIIEHIDLSECLSILQKQVLKNIPTWMAGSVKIVVQYRTPFWKKSGISGN
jgi:monoamine oxidase